MSLEKQLEKLIMSKIKRDPNFLLWFKEHYYCYIRVHPLEPNIVKEIWGDKIFYKWQHKYAPVLKKRKISILDKLKYYIKDLILSISLKEG